MDVLISAGAQLECSDTFSGLSAIHRAARLGTQPKILEMILRAKACVHLRDSTGKGPLAHAAETDGGENLVNMLISAGANVDAKDEDQGTGLPRNQFELSRVYCFFVPRSSTNT